MNQRFAGGGEEIRSALASISKLCHLLTVCIWYMVWYDMRWYDMIWYDMIWYDMIWYDIWCDVIWYNIWYDIWYDIRYDTIYDMIYLIAIGLTPGGSSTVHIYTQTVHEQHNRQKKCIEQHN